MKIGSGCTVKTACDLDHEIEQLRQNGEQPKKVDGSCHFSFCKSQILKSLNQFNLAELFNPPRDYDVRPNNPPGRFDSWFHFLIKDFSERLATTASSSFFD